VTESQGSYERGHLAGEVAARLAGHDRHFAAINGHLAQLAQEVRDLRLAVQRIADQDDAAVGAAVASRARAAERWLPVARVATVTGIVATLVGVYYAIRHG
jgi:hypothetical protein